MRKASKTTRVKKKRSSKAKARTKPRQRKQPPTASGKATKKKPAAKKKPSPRKPAAKSRQQADAKHRTPATVSGKVRSFRALAEALGLSHTAVLKWRRHPEWDFRTPFDVEDVRRWAARTLPPPPLTAPTPVGGNGRSRSAGEIGAERKERKGLVRARRLLLEQQLAKEAAKLHDVADCRARRLQQIADVKNRLLALPEALAGMLEMVSSEEATRQLEMAIRGILADLSREKN